MSNNTIPILPSLPFNRNAAAETLVLRYRRLVGVSDWVPIDTIRTVFRRFNNDFIRYWLTSNDNEDFLRSVQPAVTRQDNIDRLDDSNENNRIGLPEDDFPINDIHDEIVNSIINNNIDIINNNIDNNNNTTQNRLNINDLNDDRNELEAFRSNNIIPQNRLNINDLSDDDIYDDDITNEEVIRRENLINTRNNLLDRIMSRTNTLTRQQVQSRLESTPDNVIQSWSSYAPAALMNTILPLFRQHNNRSNRRLQFNNPISIPIPSAPPINNIDIKEREEKKIIPRHHWRSPESFNDDNLFPLTNNSNNQNIISGYSRDQIRNGLIYRFRNVIASHPKVNKIMKNLTRQLNRMSDQELLNEFNIMSPKRIKEYFQDIINDYKAKSWLNARTQTELIDEARNRLRELKRGNLSRALQAINFNKKDFIDLLLSNNDTFISRLEDVDNRYQQQLDEHEEQRMLDEQKNADEKERQEDNIYNGLPADFTNEPSNDVPQIIRQNRLDNIIQEHTHPVTQELNIPLTTISRVFRQDINHRPLDQSEIEYIRNYNNNNNNNNNNNMNDGTTSDSSMNFGGNGMKKFKIMKCKKCNKIKKS